MIMGGHGAILSMSNLVPQLFLEMYIDIQENNFSRAKEIQFKIVSLAHFIYSEPNPGPLKYALSILKKPGGGITRKPIYSISKETEKGLQKVLRKLELLT